MNEKIIRLSFLLFGAGFTSRAQNAMFSSPDSATTHPPVSCTVCAGSLWANETNIKQNDLQFAETILQPYLFCFQSLCYRSRYLVADHFNFNIPPVAVLLGLEVHIMAKADLPGVLDSTLRLCDASGMVGDNKPGASAWGTALITRTYGSPTDMWNAPFDASSINDSRFGLYYKVYNNSDSSPVFSIDQIKITVYYSTPQGLFSQTSTASSLRTHYEGANENLRVWVDVEGDDEFSNLQILDLSGRVLLNENVPFSQIREKQIAVPGYRAGLYIVKVSGADKVLFSKIVIGDN